MCFRLLLFRDVLRMTWDEQFWTLWGRCELKEIVITRPGKHTKNYGTSPFLMGKLTISTGPCSILC